MRDRQTVGHSFIEKSLLIIVCGYRFWVTFPIRSPIVTYVPLDDVGPDLELEFVHVMPRYVTRRMGAPLDQSVLKSTREPLTTCTVPLRNYTTLEPSSPLLPITGPYWRRRHNYMDPSYFCNTYIDAYDRPAYYPRFVSLCGLEGHTKRISPCLSAVVLTLAFYCTHTLGSARPLLVDFSETHSYQSFVLISVNQFVIIINVVYTP